MNIDFFKNLYKDDIIYHYTKACIAFSKEKILTKNKRNLELIEDKVKYLTFQELSVSKLGDIQGDHLKNVGKVKYKQQLEQLVKQSFFYKHVDYSGKTNIGSELYSTRKSVV